MKVKFACVNKRNIKHARLELKSGNLNLIIPSDPSFDAQQFIDKHADWIKEKNKTISKIKNEFKNKKLETRTDEQFREMINLYIKRAEDILKVSPKNVYIKKMKTKWGSCSKNKNLSFNAVLRYLSNRMIWYVVYHEMAHLIVPKHNDAFWYLIKYQFEKLTKYEKDLFGYWFLIKDKVRGMA